MIRTGRKMKDVTKTVTFRRPYNNIYRLKRKKIANGRIIDKYGEESKEKMVD